VIRYALVCHEHHVFESWFKSSGAFDTQLARKLLACPVCGSTRVEKAIMAPSVVAPTPRRPPASGARDEGTPSASRQEKSPLAMLSDRERVLREKLKELRNQLVKNADYVGHEFPEQARRMHYGETERRSIYGEASAEEAAALSEEGIEFHPLPHLPEDRN
jgi:hypothetical protein